MLQPGVFKGLVLDFKSYFSQEDSLAACLGALEKATKDLSFDNLAGWKPLQQNLINAMSAPFAQLYINAVLAKLPPAVVNETYKDLLDSPTDTRPVWFDKLVQFAVETVKRPELKAARFELLLSPFVLTRTHATILHAEMGVNVLCSAVGMICCDKPQASLGKVYQSKLEQLLDDIGLLIIDWGDIGSADLANKVAIQRMARLKSERAEMQRNFIEQLLKNKSSLDWSDASFRRRWIGFLCYIFSNHDRKEMVDWINTSELDRSQQISLLEELYQLQRRDKDVISDLIKLLDDAECSLTIAFINTANIDDYELRKTCFDRIPLKNMIPCFTGMLKAESHPEEGLDKSRKFAAFIQSWGERFLKIKDNSECQELAGQVAALYANLPDKAADQLFAAIRKRICHSLLHYRAWLLSLLQQPVIKKPFLFPLMMEMMKAKNRTLADCSPLLEGLDSLHLAQLYDFFCLSGERERADKLFAEFLQPLDRRALLTHFILNIPALSPTMIAAWNCKPDDTTLLTLMFQLVEKVKQSPEFAVNLEQVLQYFAKRLSLTNSLEGPIHQWQQDPTMPDLVYYLLLSWPVVYMLGHSTTSFTSLQVDLSTRIDRVLNASQLNENQCAAIALSWFNFFMANPYRRLELSTILRNLNNSEKNRSDLGKQNLKGLQQQCWLLFNKPLNEFTVEGLIKEAKSLTPKSNMDWFRKMMLEGGVVRNYPREGARLLGQMEDKEGYLGQLDAEQLVEILFNSNDAETQGNWGAFKKIIDSRKADLNREWMLALIGRAACLPGHTSFHYQLRQIVVETGHLEGLLPSISMEALQWIIRSSKPEWIESKLPNWVGQVKCLGDIDSLISILLMFSSSSPCPREILNNLQANHVQLLPQLLVSLMETEAGQALAVTAFPGLLKSLRHKQPDNWKEFIRSVYRCYANAPVPIAVVELLNNAIVDQTLEVDVLQIHFAALHAAWKGVAGHEDKARLAKGLEHLIRLYAERDNALTRALFSSDFFAELIASSLAGQQNNPLLDEILPSAAAHAIPSAIKTGMSFQMYVLRWLRQQFFQERLDHIFQVYDSLLLEAYQKKFLHDLLGHPLLTPGQSSLLLPMGRILSLDALFELMQNNAHPARLTLMVLRDESELRQLTAAQKKQLLETIKTANDLHLLLDCAGPVKCRALLLQWIYEAYPTVEALSAQFDHWRMSRQCFLVLANLTVLPKHKDLLKQLIKQAGQAQCLDWLYDYMADPKPPLPLDGDDFLTAFSHEMMRHPQWGQYCAPAVIKQVKQPDLMRKALQAALDVQAKLKTWQRRAQSWASCINVAPEAVLAMRWLLQLGLLSDGVAAAWLYYAKNPDRKAALAGQQLFKNLIVRLNKGELTAKAWADLQSRLSGWMQEYQNHIPKQDGALAQRALEGLAQECRFMQVYLPPQLQELFKPDSSTSMLCQGKNDLYLDETKQGWLVKGAEELRQWLNLKHLSPEAYLQNLLNHLLTLPEASQDNRLINLIFTSVLATDQSRLVDSQILEKYIAAIGPQELILQLNNINAVIRERDKLNQAVQSLQKATNWNELIDGLLSKHPDEVARLAEDARQRGLHDLCSAILFSQYVRVLPKCRSLLLPEASGGHLSFEPVQAALSWLSQGYCQSELLQQVLLTGFSCQKDEFNIERLRMLASSKANDWPAETRFKCLKSYQSLWTDSPEVIHSPLKDSYLQALTAFLLHCDQQTNYLKGMPAEIMAPALTYACEKPGEWQVFLQLVLNSDSYGKQAHTQLRKKFDKLRTKDGKTFGADDLGLCLEAVLEHMPAVFAQVVAIARLLIMTVSGNDHFRNYEKRERWGNLVQQQACCMDVELNAALQTQKVTEANKKLLDDAKEWLMKLAASHPFSYFEHYGLEQQRADADWQESPFIKNTYFRARWILWQADMINDNAALIVQFSQWIKGQTDLEKEQCYLLRQIKARGQVPLLCQVIGKDLEAYASCLPILANILLDMSFMEDNNSVNKDIVSAVAKLAPVRWYAGLQLKHWIVYRELFSFLVNQKEFSKQFSNNPAEQEKFIRKIKDIRLPIGCVRELIQVAPPLFKSLLAIALAGLEGYVSEAGEQSLHTQMLDGSFIAPARLLGDLNHINPEHLPPTLIAQLPPQVAISLFLGIRQLPYWKTEQVDKMLSVSMVDDPLLSYWFNHCADYPNAGIGLMRLINLNPGKCAELIKVTPFPRTWLRLIIRHIDQLNGDLPKPLQDLMKSDLLAEAIALYLAGHQHEKMLAWIKAGLDRFAKDDSLPDSLLSQLFRLPACDFPQIKRLYSRQMNVYIRQQASKGGFLPFIESERCLMQRPFTVVNSIETPDSEGGLAAVMHPEHALIGRMRAKNGKDIRIFDYFVLHFKTEKAEDWQKFEDLLRQYINFRLSPQVTLEKVKQLEGLAYLMIQDDVNPETKSILMKVFRDYPKTFENANIASYLLRYQADLIRDLGQRKAYDQVQALCSTDCVASLNQAGQPELAKRASRACADAGFERMLASLQGWFVGLRRWLKRCWHYGFFTRAKNRDVAPFDGKVEAQNTVPIVNNLILISTPDKDLRDCLPPKPVDKTQLAQQLRRYLQQPTESYDLKLLKDVDQEYQKWLEERKQDQQMDTWLTANQSVFIDSRAVLVARLLREEKLEDAIRLLATFKDGPGAFDKWHTALTLPVPKRPEPITMPEKVEKTLVGAAQASKGVLSWALTSGFNWVSNKLTGAQESIPPLLPGPEQSLDKHAP